MNIFTGKKGIGTGALVAAIIILMSLVGMVWVIVTQMDFVSDEAQIMTCKMSVMQRAITKNPLTGGSFGELQCSTIRKKVGGDSPKKEDVMEEISDYTLGCWRMFGEGVLRSLRGDEGFWRGVVRNINFFGSNSRDTFCFICYDLLVEDLEQNINQQDLFFYMRNSVYFAQEFSCPSGDTECEERITRLDLDPCTRRGGDCLASCDINTQVVAPQHENWMCKERGKSCCLDRRDVFTYYDYIRYHGGMGGALTLFEQSFPLVKGQRYAVVYVEPSARDEPSFVAIGTYEALQNSGCIQK